MYLGPQLQPRSRCGIVLAAALLLVGGCTDPSGPPTVEEREAQRKLGELEAKFRHNREGRVTAADLGNSAVEDADLAHLPHFERVEELVLSGTEVTDRGLHYVRPLSRLKRLSLRGTDITDAGLAALTGLPLIELDLENTQITDAGLQHLAEIHTLRKLYLGGTNITYRGTQELKKAVPGVDILTD